MPHPHEGGGLSSIARGSTGSTSSGGLTERFKQNPLGVIGTALQSFIEGSQGKPISALGREADKSKREFERRRLAILESGEKRASSAEKRAVKKGAADEARQKQKDADARLALELSLIESGLSGDDETARQNINTIREHGVDTETPRLVDLANRMEAVRNNDPQLKASAKIIEDKNVLPSSVVQRIVSECSPLGPGDNITCFSEKVKEERAILEKRTQGFNNSELLAAAALAKSGAEVPKLFAPKIIEAVEEAQKVEGGLDSLIALAQTRVVTDKPTGNRTATIRAKIANIDALDKFAGMMIGFIDENPAAFGGPGAVRDPITNIVQVMRDLGGSVIPALSALVIEARNEAIQTGDAEIIDLFTKFDPIFPQADVIVSAMAVQYARALRSVSGGERGGISIKEVQRAEKVLKIRGAKGVQAIREVFATLRRDILPTLKTTFQAELGGTQGLKPDEVEQLKQFEQDFNLGQ